MENLNINEIFYLLTVLAIAAAVAGFMAGLLGVGGGIIMVPALYYAFTVLDFDIVTRMHLAVGTAFFITIFTSTASVLTHRKHNAVDFFNLMIKHDIPFNINYIDNMDITIMTIPKKLAVTKTIIFSLALK